MPSDLERSKLLRSALPFGEDTADVRLLQGGSRIRVSFDDRRRHKLAESCDLRGNVAEHVRVGGWRYQPGREGRHAGGGDAGWCGQHRRHG